MLYKVNADPNNHASFVLTLLNYIKSIDNNNNKTIIIITIIIIIIINIKFPDKSARIASLSSNGNT